jgi:hypothetical protein
MFSTNAQPYYTNTGFSVALAVNKTLIKIIPILDA